MTSTPDIFGTHSYQGHNLVGVNDGSFSQATDQGGTLASPLDPRLGPLAGNGGPTLTHKLLAGSPALDAGDNCVRTPGGCGTADPPAAVTQDQRGFPRADDAADPDTTDTVDIGAVEMQVSVQTFADATITQDTIYTVTDFIFADTTGASTPAGQRLGAPDPQNLASPVTRNANLPMPLLDQSQCSTCAPNRLRVNGNDGANTNGTISLRRRVQNNTPGSVTRLRFRIVDVSTLPAPGTADVRARTSSDITGVQIFNDSATCGGTTSCTVTVKGTTLETPPAQALGGGFNATWVVTLGTPLSPGQSVNVQLVLGVMQGGNYSILINTEALP